MSIRFASRVRRSVLALLVLGCAALAVAAEDEEKLKTPQPAVVQFANGKSVRGTLLSVSATEVRFQLAREGTVPVKYKLDAVKAVQTAAGVWVYNADKGRLEKMRPPGAKGPAPDKGGDDPAAEREEAQTVVVEGAGADRDEAVRDAFRAALRKVVGTLVDAETLVRNDKVISDKVLTFSDGVIARYDKLEEKNEDGLVRVKIRAVVEPRKLVARLREFKVTAKEVRGRDIAAEVMTRQEARANATELLQKELDELPRVLVAEARKFNARDYDEDTGCLRVDVFVKADPDKYRAFLKRLVPLLDKICLDKGVTLVECEGYEGGTVRRTEGSHCYDDPVLGGFKKSSIKKFANQQLPPDQKGWFLWVMTNIDALATGTRWDVYLVDSDPARSLAGASAKPVLLVSLVDADGETVTEAEVSLDDPHGYKHWLLSANPYAKDRNVCLAPLDLYVVSERLDYKPTELYRSRVRVTVKQLDRVKDIKCSVTVRAADGGGRKKGAGARRK